MHALIFKIIVVGIVWMDLHNSGMYRVRLGFCFETEGIVVYPLSCDSKPAITPQPYIGLF